MPKLPWGWRRLFWLRISLTWYVQIISYLVFFLFFSFLCYSQISMEVSLSGQLVSLSFGSVDFCLCGLWKELKNLWGGGVEVWKWENTCSLSENIAANIVCSLQAPFFSWPRNQCYQFAARKKISGVSVSATYSFWGFVHLWVSQNWVQKQKPQLAESFGMGKRVDSSTICFPSSHQVFLEFFCFFVLVGNWGNG
jgi:hypothetical protein